MANKIQLKRGNIVNLPTLSVAEMGYTTDTQQLFIGSGSQNIEIGKQKDITTINQTLNGTTDTSLMKTKPAVNTNRFTYGTRKNAVVMAVQGNKTDQVEVLGINSPSELATYSNRDSVALYVDNVGTPYNTKTFTAINETSITLSSLTENEIQIGSIIDLTSLANLNTGNQSIIQGNKYSGMVTAVNGLVVTVSGWFKMGNTANGQVPIGVDRAILNPINKIWGINLNVTLDTTSDTHQANAIEIGIINKKTNGNMSGIDLLADSIAGVNIPYGFRVGKYSTKNFAFDRGFHARGCATGFESDNTNVLGFKSGDYEVTGDGRLNTTKVTSSVTASGTIDPKIPVNLLTPTADNLTFNLTVDSTRGSFITRVFALSHPVILHPTSGVIVGKSGGVTSFNLASNQGCELFCDGTNFYVLALS